MTFTKEQLIERCKSQAEYAQEIIDLYPDDVGAAESRRIAEIALAALAGMETEPVAYVDPHAFQNFSVYRAGETDNKRMGREWMWANPDAGLIPVYTAPQPLTTSERAELENYRNAQQAVPDVIFPSDSDAVGYLGLTPLFSRGQILALNACRAAMQSGTKSVYEKILIAQMENIIADLELPVNASLVDITNEIHRLKGEAGLKDGWVACSERMPDESGRYWCYVEEQNSLGKSCYQWNCSWNGDAWGGEMMYGLVTHWQPLPAAPQQEVK